MSEPGLRSEEKRFRRTRGATSSRPRSHPGSAASDDAGGASAATAATFAAVNADREACAEVARRPGDEEGKSRVPLKASKSCAPLEASKSRAPLEAATLCAERKPPALRVPSELEKLPPGQEVLPDGPAFVEAVHARVDLVRVAEKLLRSDDEKIVQRILEMLRDMKYGKDAEAAEETRHIFIDVPRPQREPRSVE